MALNYKLNLNLSSEDTALLNSVNQRIMIAKPIGGGQPSTIWQDIDPMQNVQVDWEEFYYMYASDTQFANGAEINTISETKEAADGKTYPFENNVFQEPVDLDHIDLGTFAARNKMPVAKYPSLIFGISQEAQINQRQQDRKPICAVPVLPEQLIRMTPFTSVWVWVESQSKSNTIITQVNGNAAQVTFGGSKTVANLTFDHDKSMFIEN